MWIMLIKKLTTVVSPPKMSIFWSEPWPNKDIAKRQKKQLEEVSDRYLDGIGYGFEPHFGKARKIMYKDEAIRVFPHEFSAITAENMKLYVEGDGAEPSHEIIPGTVAEAEYVKDIKSGIKHVLYEQALLDGCTDRQAFLTAMSLDVTDAELEFPPIGWYRIKPEYGEYYCYPEELEETDRREEFAKEAKELEKAEEKADEDRFDRMLHRKKI